MRLLLIVVLLVSLASVAQESAEYRACLDKATTQMAMNTCASEEAARVGGRLNEVYHKLLVEAAKPPEAVRRLKVLKGPGSYTGMRMWRRCIRRRISRPSTVRFI